MTPAGRHPRGNAGRAKLTVVRDEPVSGDVADVGYLIDDMIKGVATVADSAGPLDAEIAGALFVTMTTAGGDEMRSAVVQELIPQIEATGGSGALALLLAIGSVGSGVQEQVAEAASAAAGRLVEAGTPEPPWAGELTVPVRIGQCMRLASSDGAASVLAASFRRAGRGHAVVVLVDELDCGAATDILPMDADDLPGVLDDIHHGARADGLDFGTRVLDPAEWRWYAEQALDARAVHDGDGSPDTVLDMFDVDEADADEDEGPPFPVLAQLLRAWLSAQPSARRPADAPVHPDSHAADALLDLLASFAEISGGRPPVGFGRSYLGRLVPAKLPAKRTKSDGPAPIYQIKVGLRGAKPPIWRRLLVPGDIGLGRLHNVIQAAFGWNDSHLHVFETPYGEFGQADRELGHRAEAPVTLEQVAPAATDTIRYRYDFGDDWEHEIRVEKILDRDPALTYPCCTGGRRAAPPDDCGGIWGYGELVEILADPRHPEHRDRLEWLDLDDPSQFDPAAFDVNEVNRSLAPLSGRRARRGTPR